jgi:prepilin-type processing-associated H-X9-DG protein
LFEEAGPREGCFSGRDIPNNRHGDKTNVGFADGHVSGQRYAPGLNANGICRELDFDPPLIIVPD